MYYLILVEYGVVKCNVSAFGVVDSLTKIANVNMRLARFRLRLLRMTLVVDVTEWLVPLLVYEGMNVTLISNYVPTDGRESES